MTKKPLSATMEQAITVALRHRGKLERLPGGYWTYPGCGRSRGAGAPDWYVGATTIDACVDRGRMKFTEWKEGRDTRFPIAVEVIG
jgi:hypothetical protein